MPDTVECDEHGGQLATYVCRHIVEGLRTKTRVGFFWAYDDPDNPRPDAYCSECNELAKRSPDGEWTEDDLEFVKPRLMCGACYDLAKTFHLGGDPWH